MNTIPPKPPNIIEIIWTPPALDWIKANTDGASASNPGPSSCGGIFRNKNGDHLGSFVIPLGHDNAFSANLNVYTPKFALPFSFLSNL